MQALVQSIRGESQVVVNRAPKLVALTSFPEICQLKKPRQRRPVRGLLQVQLSGFAEILN